MPRSSAPPLPFFKPKRSASGSDADQFLDRHYR
jgi:hypothetical protein